jgi:glucose/arabinose dehydrogenase
VIRPSAASLVLALLLLAAAPAQAAPRLEKVGDFDQPVFAVGAPGDYSRLYVVERTGTVRVVRGGRISPTPFLTLPDVSSTGERGLLSLAFPFDFQTSRLVYAYYTLGNGNVRVDQFRAGSPDRVDPGSQRKVIELGHQAAPNHNGGTVAFGPDGYLWLAPGDGGGGQSGNAQSLNSPLGKVLRIRPLAGGGYTVPADNPFVGRPGLDEIWSYGLRNPFRFSFDRGTGDLVIGDVGQSTTEEIDYAPTGTGRGRGTNFGWNPCEGSFVQGSESAPCPIGTRPVIDQFHHDGWLAIVGGVVVRDPSLPSFWGRYLYGDNDQPVLHLAALALPRAHDGSTGLRVSLLAGISEDTAGCVYASSLEGPVYRIVENSTAVPCPKPAPGAGRPGAGRIPLRISVRVPKRQRVRKLRGAIGYARCSEACTVSMSGRLRIGRRSYKLRKAAKRGAAHRRLKLRVKLTKRASRALRRALRRHRRARVDVALRARNSAGSRSALVHRRVRVRR